MQILPSRLRRNTICDISLSAKHKSYRAIDKRHPDEKAGKTGRTSGAAISIWIIRIISRIIIPGIIAGLPIGKKAIDIISRISRSKSSGKSSRVLAQILKLILPVRRLTLIISQIKMGRIIVIRIFEGPIVDRKSPRSSSPAPESAVSCE